MGDTRISDPVDPLADFPFASLFPGTFNRFSVDSISDSWCGDLLDAVGAHLKSMALKNPNRLLEQAKSALDGGMENLNVESLGSTRDEDNIGDLVGVQQKNRQTRRPGLGRKKARFSMKPDTSQSVEFLEPDVNKYPDPDEFFAALERHENAKKELKRQSGAALMELDQNVSPMAQRRRRPGLSRKSVSYKHLYPVAPAGDDNTLLSSQETFSQGIRSPSNGGLQTKKLDQNPLPSTGGLSGPVDARMEKPNDVSDRLHSGQDDDDDDESDKILEMLQQRYKPIELKETCLTDLPEVHRSTSKAFGDTLQASHDKMSHLHDIVSAIGREAALGCDNVERSSDNHRGLPSAPKSPYSSISSLKARLFQSRQARDPFSALDIDPSPLDRPSFRENANGLAAGVSEKSDKDSSKVTLISAANLMHEDSGHATTEDDVGERTQNSPAPENVTSDCEMHVELNPEIVGNNTRHQNTSTATHDKESNTVLATDIRSDDENPVPSQETMKDSLVMADVEMNNVASGTELAHDILANEMTGTVPVVNLVGAFDDAGAIPGGHIEMDDREIEGDARGHDTEKSNRSMNQSASDALGDLEKGRPSSDHDEQSTISAIDGHDQVGPTSSQAQQPIEEPGKASSKKANLKRKKGKEPSCVHAADLPASQRSKATKKATQSRDQVTSSQAQQPIEEPSKASSKKANLKRKKGKEPSRVHAADLPASRRSKAMKKATQSREGREISQRKSLSACGMQWQSGLRRSTRIRTRPLEYWKGERPLYGRVHDSLVTVIGTKLYSPNKENGEACMRVKSYVTDEYKEIVELAALH